MDPPYFGSVAYRRGVKPFTLADHVDLAEMLHHVEWKWLLTYNDHPKVRELYAGFPMMRMSTASPNSGARTVALSTGKPSATS